MNNLEAYKMDGLGNDFIIFDKRKKPISLSKEQIIKISDRNNIGCDQVIFIDKDKNSNAFLKFYNSDGGEISACGNGSRCVAYLLMSENKASELGLNPLARILYQSSAAHDPKWFTTAPGKAIEKILKITYTLYGFHNIT